MPTLPRRYNFGGKLKEKSPEIVNQLTDLYEDIALVVNTKVSKRVISGVSPPANDQVNSFLEIGDMWIRTDTNGVWVMTSRTTPNAVTWTAV